MPKPARPGGMLSLEIWKFITSETAFGARLIQWLLQKFNSFISGISDGGGKEKSPR